MSEYADFFPQFALAVALLLTALAAVPLFERIRLPSPAAFLAVGIAAGLLGVAPTGELRIVTLEQVGAVALFVILFQGGLGTGFAAARAAARPILALGLFGTVATAGALALAAHFVIGLGWPVALLIAVALAPTTRLPSMRSCGAGAAPSVRELSSKASPGSTIRPGSLSWLP